MPLAAYRKSPPVPHYVTPVAAVTPTRKIHIRHLLPSILLTLGSLMVTTAVWPIVQYQLFLRPMLTKVDFVSPVPVTAQTASLAAQKTTPTPGQIAGIQALEGFDEYVDPKTWFPEADFSRPGPKPITTYTLHIPKVDLYDAKVSFDGVDLAQGLIQYPGTALPGEAGSPVIFGHSILRQFYNPDVENKQRYMSIFSKIMTLKDDDRIYLDYGDIRYTYAVRDRVEVKPEDVFILEQHYATKELKLITCVPEGTYLRRGVVIAQLIAGGPADEPLPE